MTFTEAKCQCGATRIPLPALSTPDAHPELLLCHCSHCRAQSGSVFGSSAMFPDFRLPVDTAPLGVWTRETFDSAQVKDCYFCARCGVRMVHRTRGVEEVREEAGTVGKKYEVKKGRMVVVKGGCLEGLDWSRAVHVYCGDAVVDLEFPEHVVTYVEFTDGERWGKRRVQR